MYHIISTEQKEWEIFIKDYDCKVIEKIEGKTSVDLVPYIIGENFGILDMSETTPDRVCYECNDGKKYWRNK
jgi:hypothetical protein